MSTKPLLHARPVLRRLMAAGLAGLIAWIVPGPAQAGTVLDRVSAQGRVRVCIWPEFYGVTYRNERSGILSGLDIELSREFGRDLGLKVEYIDSSVETLSRDLHAGRCDIGMFALETLRKHRRQLNYSQPYLESDVYGVATSASRIIKSWEDIDQPDVVVGVPAGSAVAALMRYRLQDARLLPIRGADARQRALEAGQVDVLLADYPNVLGTLAHEEGVRLLEPAQPSNDIPMGYAVRPGDPAWLAQIDAFVRRIKADGRLERAAVRHGLQRVVVLQ